MSFGVDNHLAAAEEIPLPKQCLASNAAAFYFGRCCKFTGRYMCDPESEDKERLYNKECCNGKDNYYEVDGDCVRQEETDKGDQVCVGDR